MISADVCWACQMLFVVSPGEAASLLTTCDQPRLKRAYRQAVRRTHPDLFGDLPEAERRLKADSFIRAGEAFRLLKDFLATRCAAARTDPPRSPFAGRPGPPSPPRSAGQSSFRGEHPGNVRGTRRALPDRSLLLGEFLVYSGVVSPDEVAQAVLWQRTAAPRLGEIASRWRWTTEAAIRQVLAERAAGEPVGALLVRHGILTPFGLKVLLHHQRKARPPIGRYFLAQGLLSPTHLRSVLLLQASHNACCRLRRR
jgi:hypothetical protein